MDVSESDLDPSRVLPAGLSAGPSGPALRGPGAGPERRAGVLPISGGSGAKARYRRADPPGGRHCGGGGLVIAASLCEVVAAYFGFLLYNMFTLWVSPSTPNIWRPA